MGAPHDADCKRYVLWIIEHLPVIIRDRNQKQTCDKSGAGAGHRAAQLPAADQSEDSDQAVQQMPGLVDADRGDTVQRRCRHVEHGAVVIKVPPVQRSLVAEKGQVVVEDEVPVPIVDILVPRDAVISESG